VAFREAAVQSYNRRVPASMDYDLLYSLIIAFAGSAQILLVDRCEPNLTMAAVLKFLLIFVSSVMVMERLRAYWISLF
jgi:hypothetical protein